MHHNRLVPLLALALLTVAACGSDDSSTSASPSTSTPTASTTTEPPGKEIHATGTSGTPKVGDPICDAEKHCMIPLTLTGTYSGDLTGTGISHGAGALFGTEYASGGTLIFTGTITGCGSGTMVVTDSGRGTTDGRGSSTWTIVDGVGTGDLVRVSGSGTTTFAPGAGGATTLTLTGRVICD